MEWVVGTVTVVLALAILTSLPEGWISEDVWNQIYHALGFSAPAAPVRPTGGDTAIHFIDVGQGDSVLIEQDGEYCLIDAGTRECEEDLLAYLDSLDVRSIRLMVMTHPHADHIGSMRAVLQHCDVQQVLLPDFSLINAAPSHTTERVLEEIALQQIPTMTAAPGQTYAIGSGTLSVLAAGVETSNYNDISPVLRFDGQGLSFIDTGDGEIDVEDDALRQNVNLPAIVLKAGHHGSDTSNTRRFVEAVGPEYVVISCGRGNSYGHPTQQALDSFAAVDAQVYRTDLLGSVVILGSPTGVEVYSSANGLEQEAAA